jgi:hypothetical protein
MMMMMMMMTWKGSERRQSWPIHGIILAFTWRDWGKPLNISFRIAGLGTEICMPII